MRNGARFGAAVSGEGWQTHGGGGMARFGGDPFGALEDRPGALFATAAAGGHAQFELKVIEGRTPLLRVAHDVAIRDAVANTDNHGVKNLS